MNIIYIYIYILVLSSIAIIFKSNYWFLIHHFKIPLTTAPCEDGEVRLMEGETEWEGRLEVCLSQRWGSVSSRASDGWPADNAQ